MTLTPEKYLEGLSNGTVPIIRKIYTDIFPKVAVFVCKNRGNEADAKDIFQKALMQIIARYKVQSFVIKHSFEAYFFTVCKNLWRKELQRRKKEVTNSTYLELDNKAHEMAVSSLEQEKWDIFNEKFNELSKNCRIVLNHFFNKMPYAEILKKMDYASDNVLRQRIFKCKKKLSELITKDPRYCLIKK